MRAPPFIDQADQHKRSGHRLSYGDPVGVNVRRKLTDSQLLARLGEDEIGVRIRRQIEIHNHRSLRIGGGVGIVQGRARWDRKSTRRVRRHDG